MGLKTSKNEKADDHVPQPKSVDHLPHITVTQPTPVHQPESPSFFSVSPPTRRNSSSDKSFIEETPILDSSSSSSKSYSPPINPPPPPPTVPLPVEPKKQNEWHNEKIRKVFGESVLDRAKSPIPPPPNKDILPLIKKPVYHAKDRIELFESIDNKDKNQKMFSTSSHKKTTNQESRVNGYTSLPYKSKVDEKKPLMAKSNEDDSVYNEIPNHCYQTEKIFHTGAFPIDMNRRNIGFCGRALSGKSTLINALRGLNNGEPQSAGRNPCDRMEPFRFVEGELSQIVLWEIPYPRSFSSINDVFDSNMGFDNFYETHKLKLFKRIFILIPDGAPTDEDVAFAKVAISRRTPVTFVSTKTDEDLDAENRETGKRFDEGLKESYERSARNVFSKYLLQKAQNLNTIESIFVNAPTVQNLVCGTVGYLHYLMDEEKLLQLVELKTGCHFELECKLRKERNRLTISRPSKIDIEKRQIDDKDVPNPYSISKPTVLADSGFEIMYGTDDRIPHSLKPKKITKKAGKTFFNYGFIGGSKVGKSSLIDSIRGISSKHLQSATNSKGKAGSCDHFEFDDYVLKSTVTLFEFHYPKKISSYFEFIDKYNIPSFTAVFIMVNGTPNEEDLAFAKIAYRQNTTILFLISKCDKKLAARSRSDEIPVCDLLKQNYIDKALNKFDNIISDSAAELRGRVNVFFVSAPVFKALRNGDTRQSQFVLHERAVFDFLKSRKMISDLLDDSSETNYGEYACVNLDSIGKI